MTDATGGRPPGAGGPPLSIPEEFGRREPGVVPVDGFVVAPDGDPAGVTGDGGEGADRSHRRRWVAAVVAGLLLVVVVVLVGGYLWVDHEANPGPPGARVIVAVAEGDSLSQVASTLEAKGVITSALAFRIWTHLHAAPVVQPGSYAFNRNDSFSAVTARLGGGPDVFQVVVEPGFTVAEVAARVEAAAPGRDATAFERLATGGTLRSPWEPAGSDSLEGLLGTGTYVLVPGETDTQVLTEMIDRFDATADASGLTAGAAALGRTPYEVITAASVVQKEAVYEKNMGPVARVIYNRLAAGMPLQMDSTVLYSEGRDGGPVTEKDLQLDTPYNTYLHHGLPPTPIGMVSPAALTAALHPTPGDWLYFVVVRSDGTEAFSDTYAGQQANEALARQRGLG